ncbi:MAG: hypothetical protein AB1298_05310, partial [Bacteroidota bacterium]
KNKEEQKMTTAIKTQKTRLMILSLAFTFFLFINNSFAFGLPDSTKSCDLKKGPSVSKKDSTHKEMKMKMGMNMNESMHKEMMAGNPSLREKNDSTSSCKNSAMREKNKEGIQESSSGKEMAMADCKMKDDEKKDCKMKGDEMKNCKMWESIPSGKEAETKEGKEKHESHHKGDSTES